MTQPADLFAAHLREHAHRYFTDGVQASIHVALRSEVERSRAILYRYDVRVGEQVHHVLAKTHRLDRRQSDEADARPLRYAVRPHDKVEREAAALRLIEAHFADQDPDRFGTIRVLDVLPEHQTILMIESQDTGLHPLIMQQNRLRNRGKTADLRRVLQNTGAWLRHYHALPLDAQVEVRYGSKRDFLHSVRSMTEFLALRTGDTAYFEQIAQKLIHLAEHSLPDQLPSGRLHGDFAARNILVGPNSRVTLIDTLARWHAPVYEDLATFLTWFDINQIQIVSAGLGFDRQWVNACKRSLLEGYFQQDDVPETVLALFQIHTVLDKWTSLVAHFHIRRQWRHLSDIPRRRLSILRFKSVIHGLLEDIARKEGLTNR